MKFTFLLSTALMLISEPISSTAEDLKPRSALLSCMNWMGQYLYTRSQNIDSLSSECFLEVEGDEWNVLQVYMQTIDDVKSNYEVFSDVELEKCHDEWRRDWAHVAAMVYDGVEGKDYYHQSYLETPVDARKFEREIIERSLIDQALSNYTVDTYGRKFVRYDGTTCRWLYSNLPLARADNVAFLIDGDLKEKFEAGDIPLYAHKPFWFILQHADLFPEFQSSWLEVLRGGYQEHGFPKKLVDELEERVEFNKQFHN